MKNIFSWRYKNTVLLVLSLVILFLLADTPTAHLFIERIGTYGYLGAAITGMFFVSTFTVAPASIVLFHLAQEFDPFIISLWAGVGAVVGDFVIFRFLKDGVFEELRPLFSLFRGSRIVALFRTPYFAWIVPVVGAVIIASPFPDEVGIAMMGLSKIKWWQFVVLTFVLNTIGIFLIVTLATNM